MTAKLLSIPGMGSKSSCSRVSECYWETDCGVLARCYREEHCIW